LYQPTNNHTIIQISSIENMAIISRKAFVSVFVAASAVFVVVHADDFTGSDFPSSAPSSVPISVTNSTPTIFGFMKKGGMAGEGDMGMGDGGMGMGDGGMGDGGMGMGEGGMGMGDGGMGMGDGGMGEGGMGMGEGGMGMGDGGMGEGGMGMGGIMGLREV
jgi:hypothetical protein